MWQHIFPSYKNVERMFQSIPNCLLLAREKKNYKKTLEAGQKEIVTAPANKPYHFNQRIQRPQNGLLQITLRPPPPKMYLKFVKNAQISRFFLRILNLWMHLSFVFRIFFEMVLFFCEKCLKMSGQGRQWTPAHWALGQRWRHPLVSRFTAGRRDP